MTTQASTTDETEVQRATTARQRRSASPPRILLHLFLIGGAIVCFFPFVFMIIKSLSSVYEATAQPPVWIPKQLMFLNYSVSWSSVPFGPSVKLVERGSIRYAYAEFWSLFFMVANFFLASFIVGWLFTRVNALRKRSNLPIVLFIVLLLPTLYLLFLGTPFRVETRDGYLPTTPEGAIKPLEVLGFDSQWSYQPPSEYLTSWEAERSLTPVVPITLGKFLNLATQDEHDFSLGSVTNTMFIDTLNYLRPIKLGPGKISAKWFQRFRRLPLQIVRIINTPFYCRKGSAFFGQLNTGPHAMIAYEL
jgi:hypothetical protein